MIIYSPLEQFECLAIQASIGPISFYFSPFIYALIFMVCVQAYGSGLYSKLGGIYQWVLESAYNTGLNLLESNSSAGIQFYPLLVLLGIHLLIGNLTSLLPSTFSLTSSALITFTLSFTFFIYINIWGVNYHGIRMLGLFLPNSTPFVLAPLLIFIEILSYVSRLFSLAIRLFANLMAGHTLIKIVVAFLYFGLSSQNTPILLVELGGILIFDLLIFLEIAVALLQVYVFIVLCSIYIKDVIAIGH